MEEQLQLSNEFLDNIDSRAASQYLVGELFMKKSLQMMHDNLDKKLAQRSELFLSLIATAESEHNTSIEPQRLNWLRDIATGFSRVAEPTKLLIPGTIKGGLMSCNWE